MVYPRTKITTIISHSIDAEISFFHQIELDNAITQIIRSNITVPVTLSWHPRGTLAATHIIFFLFIQCSDWVHSKPIVILVLVHCSLRIVNYGQNKVCNSLVFTRKENSFQRYGPSQITIVQVSKPSQKISVYIAPQFKCAGSPILDKSSKFF